MADVNDFIYFSKFGYNFSILSESENGAFIRRSHIKMFQVVNSSHEGVELKLLLGHSTEFVTATMSLKAYETQLLNQSHF